MMRLMYLEYREGEEVRQTPSCFLWDEKTLYVTHGAACALFRNTYQKLEFVVSVAGAAAVTEPCVRVGKTKSKVATHHQFIMKKIIMLGSATARKVKLWRVSVRHRDQHTIKNRQIAGRVAELCRVYWAGYEDGVYCVRVPIKDLDNVAYWDHVCSFLLRQMGTRNWRKRDEGGPTRRLAVAMGLHARLGVRSLLGTLPECLLLVLVSCLTDNNKGGL
jgi:hypothetical protein